VKIDNRCMLETAEGIDIQLTPAGLGARSMAFIIDLLIRGAILIAAAIALQIIGEMGTGLFLILLFFVEWFYPVIFEVIKGATPGKRSYGLIVVYDNGLPITLPGSLIRNLFRSIDILPFGYLSGMICMLLSNNFKRIGDHLAGTMVVYREAPTQLSQFNFESSQNETIQLTLEQQTAIVEFAERSKGFSLERQVELADHLKPLLACTGQDAVKKLQALAANLVGKA
jgi:uncharacterized RDD family membrane protein YckC